MWLSWSCPNCSDDITLYENVSNIDTVADIFTGLMESNCTKPCNTTRAKTRLISYTNICWSEHKFCDISDLFTRSRGQVAAVRWRLSPTPLCWWPSPSRSAPQPPSWCQVSLTPDSSHLFKPSPELGGALGLWLGVGIMQLVQMTIEASEQFRGFCRHKQVKAHVKK